MLCPFFILPEIRENVFVENIFDKTFPPPNYTGFAEWKILITSLDEILFSLLLLSWSSSYCFHLTWNTWKLCPMRVTKIRAPGQLDRKEPERKMCAGTNASGRLVGGEAWHSFFPVVSFRERKLEFRLVCHERRTEEWYSGSRKYSNVYHYAAAFD